MAEPTPSPALPSTADATPYVPVSWAAAAAAAVAVSFAVTLFFLGYFAFVNKKPLIEPALLVFPVVTIILCFTARRLIDNAEGTRTGELYGVNLVNTAWWLALVLGLCYIAYLFAIDYAIRRDARGEVERWMGSVTTGNEELARAFHRTLEPGSRQAIAPDDLRTMRARKRDDLLLFESSDLMKLTQRNKGEVNFTASGVTWNYKPGAIECVVTGTLKCPEGTFPVVVPLKGIEGVTSTEGGGRQWMIEKRGGYGFIDQTAALRTRYGWFVAILEDSGSKFGKEYLTVVSPGPTTHPYAYRGFIAQDGDKQAWTEIARDGLWQLAFAAPAAIVSSGYADYRENQFYKLPGGGNPSLDQKSRFFTAWDTQGIRPAGDRLKGEDGGPVDKADTITISKTAIEVRVPVEIPLPNVAGRVEAVRGRIVVVCTDPAILAELERLKAEAASEQGTMTPPEEFLRKTIPWRIARIESDMVPISAAQPRGPGGPGVPSGPPGG